MNSEVGSSGRSWMREKKEKEKAGLKGSGNGGKFFSKKLTGVAFLF